LTPFEEVLADLEAEQATLGVVLSRLPADVWDRPTHAPGWIVRDQMTHLAHFDEAAARAIRDPAGFRAAAAARAAGDRAEYERRYLAKGRPMSPPALLDWWRCTARALIEAARTVDAKSRLPWYGPDMSAASFITARLMETWSHGLDVVDAAGVDRPDTDRLRHVVFLGLRTRSFSYVNRGLMPNTAPVLLELRAPSGEVWSFGEHEAPDRIEGTATDFCRVVTQRRHVADTGLLITGLNAAEWMAISQAFAGPPGPGRQPGEFVARRDGWPAA